MRGVSEAKFWLEPTIELAQNHALDQRQLRFIEAADTEP
jgi:hypothetical protein